MPKGERDPAVIAFGALLARHVHERGMTMRAFAVQLGIAPSTLSRLRHGSRRPDPDAIGSFADALELGPAARADLIAAAELLHVPQRLRARLHASAAPTGSLHAEQAARLAAQPRWHDGWWLSYSYAFHGDGRIQRSLLVIEGASARLEVREGGRLHYAYRGSCEVLGDKVFLRVAEERGAVEYVQIILDALFDYQDPAVLLGLICGISGKDTLHPLSRPAAARIVLLHLGPESRVAAHAKRIAAQLGSWTPAELGPCWPTFLGPDDAVRDALRLRDEPLNEVVSRLIGNRNERPEQPLGVQGQ